MGPEVVGCILAVPRAPRASFTPPRACSHAFNPGKLPVATLLQLPEHKHLSLPAVVSAPRCAAPFCAPPARSVEICEGSSSFGARLWLQVGWRSSIDAKPA